MNGESVAINGGTVITQDQRRSIFRANLLVEGGLITRVSQERLHGDVEIRAEGKAVMPGFGNTHCHAAMSHLKGKLDDMDLHAFLEKTFDLDARRTEEGLYNSSLLSMAEMISSGITLFSDLYYGEDVVEKAALKSGIRSALFWNTLDENLTTQKGNPVRNAEKFIRSDRTSDLIQRGIGIQGVYVASDDLFSKVNEVAERYSALIHMHLSETRKEVYDCLRERGKRPVELLASLNFLSSRVIVAHSVWVNMNELNSMAKAGTKVSWNAISNAKLGEGGVAPIPEMLRRGISVSLGTDSNGSNNSLNMFECMKFSSLQVKGQRWDASQMDAQTMLDMATMEGYRSLGLTNGGIITEGSLADIITLDLKAPNMIPSSPDNLVQNIVYSANPENVCDVLIGGNIVKRNHKLTTIDPRSLIEANFV